jgi:hypothetical protein
VPGLESFRCNVDFPPQPCIANWIATTMTLVALVGYIVKTVISLWLKSLEDTMNSIINSLVSAVCGAALSRSWVSRDPVLAPTS